MKNKLISFSIQNIKPFAQNKTFDVDIDKINFYTITGEIGSGKSNIIKSLELFQFLLVNSYKLFSFVSSEKYAVYLDKPINFKLIFKIKDKIYRYEFSIIKNIIIKESLIISDNNKPIEIVFNRTKKNITVKGYKASNFKLVKPTELLMSYLAYNKNENFLEIYNFLTKEIIIKRDIKDCEEYLLSEYSSYFNQQISSLKSLYELFKKEKNIFNDLKKEYNLFFNKNINFKDKKSSSYKAFILLFLIKYSQLTGKTIILDNLDNYLNYSFLIKLINLENFQLIGVCNTIENFYSNKIKKYIIFT